jgi:hypothetical protein
MIIMSCRLSDKDGKTKLICNQVKELNKENAKAVIDELERANNGNSYSKSFNNNFKNFKAQVVAGSAFVLMPTMLDRSSIEQVKSLLKKYPGPFKVHLLVKGESGYKKIVTSFSVADSADLKREVEEILGEDSFRVEKE